MSWLNFLIYLVAGTCGVIAVIQWRRTQLPIWIGLGLMAGAGAWAELAAGTVIGALVMAAVFATEWALGALRVIGMSPADPSLIGWLFALLIAAFWEEFLFRSLILNGLVVALRRRWLAVALMALLFGLAHAANPSASARSVVGNALGALMYAVAFLGSGRIWLPTGLHFAWNYFQGPVLGFPVSGIDMGGLIRQNPIGSELLTGGSYGPEAGLVGMAFRFAAIALVAGWLTNRRRSTQGGRNTEV